MTRQATRRKASGLTSPAGETEVLEILSVA